MRKHSVKQPEHETTNPEIEALQYQLEFLKMEVETINEVVGRIDEITQTTKNWSVITWAGGIALGLGEPTLRPYIAFTAILPMLFWYIDAHWRSLQRRSTFRIARISEFLNSEELIESYKQKKLIGFTVLDPTGRQYRKDKEYKNFYSIRRTLGFPEVRSFYASLVLISLGLGLFFAFLR